MENTLRLIISTYFRKAILIISITEIIMILFIDYIIANKLGINIYEKFLISYNAFVLNIFSVESLTIIIIFVMTFFSYTVFFPLFLPTIIFKIVDLIYLSFELIIVIGQSLYHKIFSIFNFPKRILIYKDGLEDIFLLLGFIKNDNGKITATDKSYVIIEIQKDLSGEHKAYNFFVKLTALFSSAYLLSCFLNGNKYLNICILFFLFSSLFISYCFFKIMLRLDELNILVQKIQTIPLTTLNPTADTQNENK